VIVWQFGFSLLRAHHSLLNFLFYVITVFLKNVVSTKNNNFNLNKKNCVVISEIRSFSYSCVFNINGHLYYVQGFS
jgi:hypothetical protein